MTPDVIAPDVSMAVSSILGSGIGGLAVWFLFRRPIENMGQRLHDQEQELRNMRDERLAKLEAHVNGLPSAERCDALHTSVNARLRDGQEEFRAIRDDVSMIRADVEASGAIIKLIASNLGVQFRDGKGHR